MMEGEGQSESVSNKQEVIEQLKENSLEWVDLDDNEQKAKEALKTIAARKKELSESILEGLKQIDNTQIKLRRGGFLKFSTSTSYAPLKKDDIFHTLRDELGSEVRAREIIDKLYSKEGKEAKQITSLKRTKR